MSRRVAEDAFDGGFEGEPIALAQSWQAYSIPREHFTAGRTDLKARGVHFATYPNFAPTRAELETRARQCGFQYAMLQHFAGAVGERQKLISEDTELFDFSASGADVKPEGAPVAERARDNPAQVIGEATDAVRRMDELKRALTPEQRATVAVTREDLAELIKDVFTQMQPAPVREKSMLDQMRELMQFNSELQAHVTQNAPAPKSELSDKERLELAMVKQLDVVPEMFRTMREALGTAARIDEPRGWTDRLFELARDFVPHVAPVIAPIVGGKIISLLSNVDEAALAQAANAQIAQAQAAPVAQTPTTQPQTPQPAPVANSAPPVEPQNADTEEPFSFDTVIGNIKADIIAGVEPEECVGDVIRLRIEQPALVPFVDALLGKTNDELISILHQATGADLSGLANANEYLDGLRAGVRARLQPAFVDASPNGNSAHAAV